MFKTDIALRDMDKGFLPFISAFMSFMACLVLAVAIAFAAASGDWERRLAGSAIVQIMPDTKSKNPEAEVEARIKSVKAMLGRTPGVKSYNSMGLDETRTLLKPWIGDVGELKLGITLPRLITIEASDMAPLSIPNLKTRIADITALASVETYESWSADFRAAMRAGQATIGLIILVILAATAVTISYAAKTGFAANRSVISIMHMVGAENKYIAGQFSAHMTKMAAIGSIAGYLCAIAVLALVAQLAESMSAAPLPELVRPVAAWLVAIPAASTAIAYLTSTAAVKYSLGRLV